MFLLIDKKRIDFEIFLITLPYLFSRLANSQNCACGLPEPDHENYIPERNATTWTPDVSTRPLKTKCYGELVFASDLSNNKSIKNVKFFKIL